MILTGAESGIGVATVLRFATEGATVIAVGRAASKLQKTVADAEGAVEAAVGDISDQAEITAIIDRAAARHGRVDVLVNNAASAAIDRSSSMVHGRTCRRSFLCLPRCVSSRAYGRRRIVNVGSVSGLGADWRMAAFNTATAR